MDNKQGQEYATQSEPSGFTTPKSTTALFKVESSTFSLDTTVVDEKAHLADGELTILSVGLMVVLGVILSGANTYLGLFSGFPISVSIPSSIMSMGIHKMFRRNNILANNIVQTGASSGGLVAGASLIVIPSFLIIKYWKDVNYWQTTTVACIGSLLGIVFSIPLRRILIIEKKLKFPEGIATAEVLKIGETDKGSGLGPLYIILIGAAFGSLFKFLETGLCLWEPTIQLATYLTAGSSLIFYVSTFSSPALISVGYIVGIKVSTVVFLGAAIGFWGFLPLVSDYYNIRRLYPNDAVKAGQFIFGRYVRYVGVGAMVLGSFVATVGLLPSLLKGLKAGLDGFKSVYYKVLSLFGKAPSDYSGDVYVIRTERDIPFWVISGMCLVLIVPLIILFYVLMHSLGLSLFMTSFVIILGFMFSACSGLLAGMIGSSNNPISGITLATVLTGAICLQLILPNDVGVVGPAAALFMGCIIACAAALSSDNMQDLKCGYVVGSTPWKQQLAQLLGCIVPSLVLAPIIMLLNNAYGIGIPPSEKYPTPLAAPQARLLADVARGVFTHKLPWGMVGMGIVTACVIVALDWLIIYKIFRSNKYRVSVLAVATGLYLPFELSVPILIGGILSVVSKYYVRWRVSNLSKHSHAPELELDIMGDESVSTHNPDGVDIAPVDNIEEQMKSIVKKERCSLYRMGLLFAAGTITGESIVGIVMAIPIVIAQNTKVFAIFGNVNLEWLAPLFCFVIIVVFFGIRVGMFIPKRWWAE